MLQHIVIFFIPSVTVSCQISDENKYSKDRRCGGINPVKEKQAFPLPSTDYLVLLLPFLNNRFKIDVFLDNALSNHLCKKITTSLQSELCMWQNIGGNQQTLVLMFNQVQSWLQITQKGRRICLTFPVLWPF